MVIYLWVLKNEENWVYELMGIKLSGLMINDLIVNKELLMFF